MMRTRDYKGVKRVYVEDMVEYCVRVANKYKVKVADVIEAHKVLELERQNDLYVADGDAFDEQIGCIGESIQDISGSISLIASAIEEK